MLPLNVAPNPEGLFSEESVVRLTILRSRASPTIHSFGVHLDTVSPPEHFDPAVANAEVRPRTRAPRLSGQGSGK